MSDIDNILQPDNLNDNTDKKNKTDKPDKNATKSRLSDLKKLLDADPVQLDTDIFDADNADFPGSSMVKLIDYDIEKSNHKNFAEQAISNIILTYVKSPKLLESPRLKDLKKLDVFNYSSLLLTYYISEANLIRVQESIDGGDMSKEMFDSVNKAQQEFRANLNAINIMLEKCEKYWKAFSETYGLENEEEKIVQESETKNDSAVKRTIVDMSKLTQNIHNIMGEQKEKEKQERKKED